MRTLICVTLAGVLLGSAAMVGDAEAGDDRRRGRRDRRDHDRYEYREHRIDRYFHGRDVYVIREYYRPYYRPLPRGLAKKYYRTGWLPPGWGRRIRPIPRYIERDLVVLPRGYRRGIIDGHAVVYDGRGMIIDIAVLF